MSKKTFVKCLPLEGYMRSEAAAIEDMRYVKTLPVYNRNGYYYNRLDRVAWFEVDGSAYLCPRPDDFLYGLSLLNAPYWRQVEREALEVLEAGKLLSREQRATLNTVREREMIRDTYRSTVKAFTAFRKRRRA